MRQNACAHARCRRPVMIDYLGTLLCDKHWTELCEKDDDDD
jgi:hypothetical protein